jgi:hypothetical protein
LAETGDGPRCPATVRGPFRGRSRVAPAVCSYAGLVAEAPRLFDWRWFLGGVGFMLIVVITARLL